MTHGLRTTALKASPYSLGVTSSELDSEADRSKKTEKERMGELVMTPITTHIHGLNLLEETECKTHALDYSYLRVGRMHASPHLPFKEGYFSWQNPLHSGRKRVSLLEEVIQEDFHHPVRWKPTTFTRSGKAKELPTSHKNQEPKLFHFLMYQEIISYVIMYLYQSFPTGIPHPSMDTHRWRDTKSFYCYLGPGAVQLSVTLAASSLSTTAELLRFSG